MPDTVTSARSEHVNNHLTPKQAIAQSVSKRVSPILMSTLTSVGGMLPLVRMPDSGSEHDRGLGAVIVGGLVVSTVITLLKAMRRHLIGADTSGIWFPLTPDSGKQNSNAFSTKT